MRIIFLSCLTIAALTAAQNDDDKQKKNEDKAIIIKNNTDSENSKEISDKPNDVSLDKEKGDHNQDGHADNGQGSDKLPVSPVDAQLVIDDTMKRLLVYQTEYTKRGELENAVVMRDAIARLQNKTTTPQASFGEEADFSCTVIGTSPKGDMGTPVMVWSNGYVTHLETVGNQDNLHGGIQYIWMSKAFAAGEHRWSDTIKLEPGIPQSTLKPNP